MKYKITPPKKIDVILNKFSNKLWLFIFALNGKILTGFFLFELLRPRINSSKNSHKNEIKRYILYFVHFPIVIYFIYLKYF